MKNTGLITLICILTLALPAYAATVTIGNYTVAPNGSVVAQMIASNVTNLGSATVNLSYNPAVVHVTSVDASTGNALTFGLISNIDNSSGFAIVTTGDISLSGLSGDVIIANFTLNATSSAGMSSPLNITISSFDDNNGNPISVSTANGSFNITPALSISANPITVTVGTASNVIFNVTSVGVGTPVSGATVTLSGAGVTASGTTNVTGIALISVNATVSGPITASASMSGFADGTTTLTAISPFQATVTIGNYIVAPNGYVVAQMIANNVNNLGSVTVNLSYNPAVVHVTSVDTSTGNALTFGLISNIDNSTGFATVTTGDISLNGLSGNVIIANFTLNAIGSNGTSSPLNITIDSFADAPAGNPIPVAAVNGTLNILTPTYMPPSPTGLLSTQGNFWINYTWQAGIGNITDSYNVSVNGIWTNGTTNTFNYNIVGPHGWSNISVYSFNSSGSGLLNATPVSANTQVANNPVIIGNVSGSYTLIAGDTLSIYPTSSDLDGDIPTFFRNFPNGTFYTNNGTLIWTTTSGDIGIHSWQISVIDGYGSISSANFVVTVNPVPTYIPPSPTGLLSTQDNFWINYTWSAGIGNLTDSYNVSVNGAWINGSLNTYNNNSGLAPHGWSNISVYSYNNSGAGTLSIIPASANTQVANNPVIIGNVSPSYTLLAGDTLSIYPTSIDLDGDIPTFARNYTNGIFFTNNGTLLWPTINSDIGAHFWQISVTDGFGSVSVANFIVTVNPVPPVLTSIVVSPLSATMIVGATQPFTATAYNGTAPMAGVNISFTGSNTTVGNVAPLYAITDAFGNATVTFSASAAGTTFVNATNGSISGSAIVTVNPQPPILTSIVVSPLSATMIVGATQPFTATAYNGTVPMSGVNISFTRSNATVGNVAPLYAITGANGNATFAFSASAAGITFVNATNGSISGSAIVTVNPQPPVLTSIVVSPLSATMIVGATQSFIATAYNGTAPMSGVNISFTGSNTTVGNVAPLYAITDAFGNATVTFSASAAGTTFVNATNGSISGSAIVTVHTVQPVLTSIVVSPLSATMMVGSTQLFTATAYNGTAPMTGVNISFTGSNTTVGNVAPLYAITDAFGNATVTFSALAAGTTLVNATNGSISGSASVAVNPVPPVLTSIVVSPLSVTLNVGATHPFVATAYNGTAPMAGVNISFTSSNTTVGNAAPLYAITDAFGNATVTFTALAAGTTFINATNGSISGSASASVNTVPPVLTSIVVSPSPVALLTGGIQVFTATAKNGSATMSGVNISWTVSNTTVGTVSVLYGITDAFGNATVTFSASAAGTTFVNATNGTISGSTIVTVNPVPPVLTSIVVSPLSASMNAGATYPFVATAYNGTVPMSGVNISFTSSNITVGNVTPLYAITDAFGNATVTFITSLSGGTTLINATNGSISGSASATVITTPPPVLTSIVVSPSPAALLTSGIQVFTATAKNGSATIPGINISWTVSNTTVGTVSVLYGITDAFGNATVTFTASVNAGTTFVNATNGSISGSSMVTVSPPALIVTATPSTVTTGTATSVTFNVTSSSLAVNGATVTLSGAGVATSGVTNATGIVIISVSPTAAGTITATASKIVFTNGITVVTATVPVLNISAIPTNVPVGIDTSVIFNVTSNGSAINRATVTLSGSATGSTRTNATGIAIIRVNAISAGTITATATMTGYTSGTTTLSATVPVLNISANPTNVIVGTPFSVTFNVTRNGTAVNSATVTLTGAGLSRTTGRTNSTGITIILVNAKSPGTITATATRTGYTSATTTLNATDQNANTTVNTTLTANTTYIVNATNTTNVQIGLNSSINANVSVNITTSTNASLLNVMPATPDYGIGTGRRAIGEYISINVTGINASNLNYVNLTVFYNKSLPAFQVNSLRIYWYDPVRLRWNALGPNVIPYPDFTRQGGPKVLNSVLNTSGFYIQVTLNHFSEFVLAADEFEPEPPVIDTGGSSSGGSGGGGGGGGGSGENTSNIEVIEKYDMQISKDVLTSYRFTSAKNPVMFVNITGNTSLGIITASVEVLKNTSTLVKVSPQGLVYKNANIWVGTSGYATPKNIKEARITFKVDNSWMSTNSVSGSDVKMLRWDGSQWTQLETAQTTNDDKYTYFEAKTNYFSPFAISALKGGEVVVPTATPVATETQVMPTGTGTPAPKATNKVPGFEFVAAVALILVANLLLRMRR